MRSSNIFDKIFPKKYDFYAMLYEQSMTNYKAVHSLEKWIKDREEADYNEVFINKSEADKIRFRLEGDLVEAFATPFDRQDIYSISVQMSKIIDCCKSMVKTMKALNIEPDATIIGMSSLLSQAALELTEAMSILEKEPAKSQSKIERIRLSENSIEEIYISGLAGLFAHNDAITILRYREIYNYLKEAAMFLGYTVDIYHRICVRMI
ncbi:MAG: DUF47 domain-containing protein [Clostridiaceae bacterium]